MYNIKLKATKRDINLYKYDDAVYLEVDSSTYRICIHPVYTICIEDRMYPNPLGKIATLSVTKECSILGDMKVRISIMNELNRMVLSRTYHLKNTELPDDTFFYYDIQKGESHGYVL